MTTNAPTTKTETLYRKYRPQSFADIIGQSEVVETLQNSIKSGSIAHAYLFSGGRGTGKTSIARIFARELGTDEQDIYEIDAASHTGVDNVRELRDGVSTLPFKSQYKVYIIDEVHMLSKQAFNALLKTLEEPPKHVIFILATTEKNKILDTILSRCQVFDFKLGILSSLVELVKKVVKSEGRTIDTESATAIAKMGDGSFRDTLSHLQKVFACTETDISMSAMSVDATDTSLYTGLLQALSDHNRDDLFAVYERCCTEGIDRKRMVESLLEKTRIVLMLRYSHGYEAVAAESVTAGDIEEYKKMNGITSHTLRDLLAVHALILQTQKIDDCFEVFLFEQVEKWEK